MSRWMRAACVAALLLGATAPGGAATVRVPSFASGAAQGTVEAFEVTEASGLAASRQNPGILWVHNDNGYPGTLFALGTNGVLAGRYYLPAVFWGDFEDVAIGPGPSVAYQYIYLGDIGDNDIVRSTIRVIRAPEPAVTLNASVSAPTLPLAGAQEILLRYPDGPFDAEGLMLDPVTGDLFIATKLTDSSRVYRATQADLASPGPVLLRFVWEIPFRSVSAGDISQDGSYFMVRRNNRASLWVRQPGQTIGDALRTSSYDIPLIGQPTEPNGEGLGFHATGAGYYTISEGFNPVLYFFRRTDSGVPAPPRTVIAPGSVWRYQDYGDDEGTAWRAPGFDDSPWSSGPGQLGYGQGDERTPVFPGFDLDFKTVTTYFRRTFPVTAPGPPSNLALRLCFNDGVAVYLNGAEILRRHLDPDAGYLDPATDSHSAMQNVWTSMRLDPGLLAVGNNALAVELHRYESFRPDLSFDLQLVEGVVATGPRFSGLPRKVNGFWEVPLAGPAGSMAEVESSTNLKAWGWAGTVVLTNGQAVFREIGSASGSPSRFYRVQP